ncbi:uncharacterized protein LOC131678352 [Topomyia yanbarensis]|uniref:uncharacterized protein LOC131678352 n=1 Tax=Topomyia yanbarensis TaxID=2498891 RepID=UPI00273BED04|nr:uncharacterized protein LOC131678352 [Topomyia yanbarensis]
MEIQFERFEQQLGFHLANFSGVRVRKFNRTTSILDGDGEIFVDVTDEYQIMLTMALSSLGNNQWNEYPVKIAKSRMCSFLNNQYKEYQEYFVESTSFPRVGDDWVCPFPKGRHWVRDFAIEGSWVPDFVPSGYWRYTISIFDARDEIVVNLIVYMKMKQGYV